MPKALASREINTFFEQPITEVKERKRSLSVKLAEVVGGVALTSFGLMIVGNIAQASADNQVIAGGRGDSTGQAYTQFLIETHQINPATDRILPVEYPAEIKPLDNLTMRESVNRGVANTQHILNTQIDPSQPTHAWGYSEGSAVVLEAANKNPGRIDAVTIDKSPYGPGGISHNPSAKSDMVQSFTKENDMIVDEQLPAHIPVDVRSNEQDGWSGGGTKIIEDFQQLMAAFQATMNGDAHAPSDPTEAHNVQHFGNVTVSWYGNNPIPVFTLDPAPAIGMPALPNFMPPEPAPAPEAPAPSPEVQPAPVDVPPAPEAPVVLASDTMPAPEAVPAPEDAPAPVDLPAPDQAQDLQPAA